MRQYALREQNGEFVVAIPKDHLDNLGMLDDEGSLAEPDQNVLVDLIDADIPRWEITAPSAEDELTELLAR